MIFAPEYALTFLWCKYALHLSHVKTLVCGNNFAVQCQQLKLSSPTNCQIKEYLCKINPCKSYRSPYSLWKVETSVTKFCYHCCLKILYTAQHSEGIQFLHEIGYKTSNCICQVQVYFLYKLKNLHDYERDTCLLQGQNKTPAQTSAQKVKRLCKD